MGGALQVGQLDQEDQRILLKHLNRNKAYPQRINFSVQANTTTFVNVSPPGDPTRNLLFKQIRQNNYVGLVAIEAILTVSPVALTGTFGIAISYSDSYQFVSDTGNTVAVNTQDTSGQQIYQLNSQGGVISDFRIIYPLNWFIPPTSANLNLFLFSTPVDGTATLRGHVILHYLQTGLTG